MTMEVQGFPPFFPTFEIVSRLVRVARELVEGLNTFFEDDKLVHPFYGSHETIDYWLTGMKPSAASNGMPTSCSNTFRDKERRIAFPLVKLYRYTDPLKSLSLDDIIGWDLKTSMALRQLREDLEAIARNFGLECLLVPREEQRRVWLERELKWKKEIERPFFNAAISHLNGIRLEESFDGFNGRVLQDAEMGRAKGYSFIASTRIGEAHYRRLREKWMSTKCLSSLPPDINHVCTSILPNNFAISKAINQLSVALSSVPHRGTIIRYYKTVGGWYQSFDFEDAHYFINPPLHIGYPRTEFTRLRQGIWLSAKIHHPYDEFLPTGVSWREVDPNEVLEFLLENNGSVPRELLKDSAAWHEPQAAPVSIELQGQPGPILNERPVTLENSLDSAKASRGRRRRTPSEIASENQRIAEVLENHRGEVTAKEIEKETGIDESTIKKRQAWKNKNRFAQSNGVFAVSSSPLIEQLAQDLSVDATELASVKELAAHISQHASVYEEEFLRSAGRVEKQRYEKASDPIERTKILVSFNLRNTGG